MNKINIHCHSNYSDGDGTSYEIARKCEDLGFCAAVITDHDYMVKYLKEFLKQRDEIDNLNASGKISIPVIQGLEVQMCWSQEGLLFGREILEKWYKESSVGGDSIRAWGFNYPDLTKEFIGDLNYGLVVAHPCFMSSKYFNSDTMEHDDYTEKGLRGQEPMDVFELAHGYEIENKGGKLFNEKELEIMKKVYPMRQYKNSDAHSLKALEICYNEIDVEIKNEDDLIKWIRSGRE